MGEAGPRARQCEGQMRVGHQCAPLAGEGGGGGVRARGALEGAVLSKVGYMCSKGYGHCCAEPIHNSQLLHQAVLT